MRCGLPYPVQYCIHRLNENGFSCFVVGGAVRDMLLNREIHDYDCTTDALPEEMKQVFKDDHVIETGLKHGTLTVRVNHMPIEITTYRMDQAYTDHRHPESVTFTRNLEEDCKRRDFTINAMCFHPFEGIIDFFHGEDDLRNKIIRTVNDPHQRFKEDALRILRAVRFASQLNFTIEEETDKALRELKNDLNYVSMERINSEWTKILSSKKPGKILKDYEEVFRVFLPELQITEETVAQINASETPNVRMALLLKDADITGVLKRMKYSNADQDRIKCLIRCAKLPYQTRIEKRRLLIEAKEDTESVLELLQALNPLLSKASLRKDFEDIQKHDCLSLSQLAVSGRSEVFKTIKPSMKGTLLKQALNAVIEDAVGNTEQELSLYIKTLYRP